MVSTAGVFDSPSFRSVSGLDWGRMTARGRIRGTYVGTNAPLLARMYFARRTFLRVMSSGRSLSTGAPPDTRNPFFPGSRILVRRRRCRRVNLKSPSQFTPSSTLPTTKQRKSHTHPDSDNQHPRLPRSNPSSPTSGPPHSPSASTPTPSGGPFSKRFPTRATLLTNGPKFGTPSPKPGCVSSLFHYLSSSSIGSAAPPL